MIIFCYGSNQKGHFPSRAASAQGHFQQARLLKTDTANVTSKDLPQPHLSLVEWYPLPC